MKAVVLHKIHDVRWEERDEPKLEQQDQVIVRMLRGGICGSDMHYYEEGKVGTTIIVKHDFILGHEGVGIVESAGDNVHNAKVGDMVVIRPACACHNCRYCSEGLYSYCLNSTHLGSASTMPHTPGLFADKVRVKDEQIRVVKNISPEIAAFAEPMAVAFNGVRVLGDIVGKDVLVMGGGPIGALCAAAAQVQGAKKVTVVDVRQLPLDICLEMGIDAVVNSKDNPEQIKEWKANKGHFDCAIEASGNAFALVDAMGMVKPEGTISQVGMFPAGKEPSDISAMIVKGLKWLGVFRFYDEFDQAVNALERGYIDPTPLISASYPAAQCEEAIKEAMSPNTSKIQLVLAEK